MNDVALFWDIENIQPSLFTISDLIEYCEKSGRLVIRRSFADWEKVNRKVAKDLILSQFELFHLPHSLTFKNTSDIAMAVNATNTLILFPNIQYYFIVSNDKDFRALVQTLRTHGKNVILVRDPNKTSTDMISVVDNYIDYNTLTDDTDIEEDLIEEMDKKVDSELIFDKLVETIEFIKQEKGEEQVSHNNVITRLYVVYDSLKEDLEAIKADLGLHKDKWFRDLLSLASERNIIEVELKGGIYMLSTKTTETKTQEKVKEYFEFIIDEVAHRGNLTTSYMTNLCNDEYGVGYHKSLGFKSFKSALVEMQSQDKIRLIPVVDQSYFTIEVVD